MFLTCGSQVTPLGATEQQCLVAELGCPQTQPPLSAVGVLALGSES